MRALGRVNPPWPNGLNERFHLELRQVRDFIRMADRHLQVAHKKLSAQFHRDTAEMNDDQAREALIDRYYDFMMLEDVFPKIAASTTFIGVYSLL